MGHKQIRKKMKSYLVLLSLVFLTAITTYVLAVPVSDHLEKQDARAFRVRRDITGVFDSIANGFEGLMQGARKVSDSVLVAFNSIFSTDNKNAVTTGFATFGKGLRDAFGGIFGTNGEKVKEGVKKVGDKIKSGWENGGTSKGGRPVTPPTSPVHVPPKQPSPTDNKSAPPEGQVPQEETT